MQLDDMFHTNGIFAVHIFVSQMFSSSTTTNMLIGTSTVLFHWVQKALGLAPYMLNGEKYAVLPFMNCYTAIFLGLMSAFIALCAKHMLTIPGVWFSSYVTCLSAALSLLHLIFRQSAAVNAHNEIIATTYTLRKYKQINYETLGTVRIIEFIVSLTLVICISVYMVKSSEHSEWYSCMAVIYAMVIRVVLVNQFTWMAHAINLNLTAVNELVDNEKIYMSKELTDIAHLHERLTACGEVTNDAFSIALLCWAIESFTKLCYCFYHLCVCSLYPPLATCGPARGESFFALLWYLIQLYYTIRMCQLTMSSVASSSSIIHEILRTVETSEAITDKLEKFSFQLIPQFYFNASGYFVIDYTFLTTLAGLVTTYVIIFVQFFVMDNAKIMPDVKDVHILLQKLP